MTEGTNPPSEPIEEPVPEPEAPVEEGEKYDGGDIPQTGSSDEGERES
jgi:hypothetical protein